MKNILIRVAARDLRHAVILTMFGFTCLNPAPALAQSHCYSGWTAAYSCSQGCGRCGDDGGGGGYTPPPRDYEAERRQQEAAELRQRLAEAHAANEQGVRYHNNGEWAKAVAYYQEAASKSPDDPIIRNNLAKAKAGLRTQQQKEEAERQAKASAARMHQIIQNLAQSFDTAPSTNATPPSGGLDFDGRTAGSAPAKNGAVLEFTTTIAAPARPTTSGDPKVVDARVPRDGAYLTAQVQELARSPAADRISKGFQAVINHDWPVALAWWQDALRRDPTNARLKRSVDLAQWVVDRRKAVAAGPATPLSAAIHAAARGDNAEAIRQFKLAKAGSPASAWHMDSMIATLRQKSASKMNEAAISAAIARHQILLVGEMNDAGLKMLAAGKDREAQKLFDDAQFFSVGLSPKQVRSYDSPYFGPMNTASNKQQPSQATPAKAKPQP